MSWINKTNNSSYNFVAPIIDSDADSVVEVTFPTAEKQVLTPAATMPININRSTTVVDMGTLSAAATLNAEISDDVQTGAIVHVKVKSDGTARDVTFGTGFTSPVLAGTSNKTKVQSFMYDGTVFFPMGAALQID